MKFEKHLSRNDIGLSGSHQSGFLIPKSNKELISFLPDLAPDEINPSRYVDFFDREGTRWRLRYIYYNTKKHSLGTRDEYRITRTSSFMRKHQPREGDVLVLSKSRDGSYLIELVKRRENDSLASVVKLRGWKVVY